MRIEITNRLTVRNVPPRLEEELINRLKFRNPKFEENEKYGYWQGDTPEWLRAYDWQADAVILPRGFIRQLLSLCRREGIGYDIADRRRTVAEVPFTFKGKLRPFQEEAVKACKVRDFGTLSAPTGSGKTIMALWLVAQRKQPTLIVCHTKELLNQWKARAVEFLDLSEDEIGLIGDGEKTIGERLTIGIVNSVYRGADEIRDQIGNIVVDECHRAPARTFTEAVTAFDSKYMLGLSATPWRRDGLSKLIFWHIGDVVHEISKEDLIETGHLLPAEVIIRETDFLSFSDPSTEYSKMLSELTEDEERNLLIASDVATEANNGSGIILVLTDRKAHCQRLQEMLRRSVTRTEVLTGDAPTKERERIVEDLNAGKIKVLIATGQLIGEGFDCKELSTLFLATPIKFSGRLLQYLGRVLRPAPNKNKATIYDYIDSQVGVLVAAAKARARVYGQGEGLKEV